MRAESQFVLWIVKAKVDFCPFRGPGAPFLRWRDVSTPEVRALRCFGQQLQRVSSSATIALRTRSWISLLFAAESRCWARYG